MRWLTACALLITLVTVAGAAVGSAQAAFPGTNGKIAFSSNRDGNNEIYVMNADGSNQTRLTNDAASDSVPAWSPDGSKIAFTSTRDGNYEIYVMNADGSGQTRLTNNAAEDGSPAWSGDGSEIAFTSTRDGNYEIYVMNAAGSGQTRLTNDPTQDFLPAWSPVGSKIAFTSLRGGNQEIVVMNADGSGQVNLTNTAADDYYPDWSPDGSKITFFTYRDGNYEIYVMNADGSGQVNVTNHPATEGPPAWSPDGGKIVFNTGRDGNGEIYVMNADGTGQVNLTNNAAYEDDPDWQPLPPQGGDGGKIAFMSGRDGNGDVYVMNADGSGQTRLTNNPTFDILPAWSPDGTRIAFTSGDGDVYVMNADGSGVTRLTNDPASDYGAAWSPDNNKLAFARSSFSNGDVYVMNVDGSGQTNLTNNVADDNSPAWSPDGSKIAFTTTRDGNYEIYVMNADGSGQTNLTNNVAHDNSPAWSPDGSKIAFASKRDGNDEIYVMNADGTGQTRLTSNPALDDEPAWSPDGTKIAFASNRDGNDEIYVMNADGTGQMNLTNNAATDLSPAWQPLTASPPDGGTDLYDPDVRLSDNFYPCPGQTDFNRAPFVAECLGPAPTYTPLQPLVVDTNQTQCSPTTTSVIRVQRTGPVGFAGTPSVPPPGWVDGTISWDLYATIQEQSGPAMPNVQPFPDDGARMESVGFPTGSLVVQGTFTIDPNDPSIPNITASVTTLSNDANWGVCRTFYEEVTGNDRFGPAPITGEFYVANGGALTYEVTAGPANLLGETGVAEAYFMNTFATCCDAEAPTGVNSASGHFRLQFGTWSPSEGTGGTAPTPTGTDVEVTDFAIADEDLGGVKLTFDSVTNEGAETSVVLLTSMPDQPSGFLVGDPPAVYQIETTAEGWSEIEVCLPYGSLPAGATPQIKHYVDGTWIDVPVSYDSGLPDQIVCGVVDSLSPFAVGYTHIYNVSGPFQPVDPQPTVNVMKAGRTVPVKFSLGGNFGLDVFAVGYPKSQQVACEGGDPLDAVETTSSTNSGLAYDAASGTYQYNWKTQSAWKGKCRTLVLQFSDGQELKAEFKFN